MTSDPSCLRRDLLPFTLRLPRAILEASSSTDLEIISNLGLGKSPLGVRAGDRAVRTRVPGRPLRLSPSWILSPSSHGTTRSPAPGAEPPSRETLPLFRVACQGVSRTALLGLREQWLVRAHTG